MGKKKYIYFIDLKLNLQRKVEKVEGSEYVWQPLYSSYDN